MNLFMQFTGISSWYSMYRLQQAMKAGVISRAGERGHTSANPEAAVNGQRAMSGLGRGPYEHPFLGINLDMVI